MRNIYRSLIGACIAAIGLCFSGWGFASERYDVIHTLRYIAADAGTYGAESAKCKAELAHMASIKDERTSISTGLTRESNGFRLSAMTNTESGVAGGMSGVGPGHQV